MCVPNRITLTPGNINPKYHGKICGQQYAGNQNDGAVMRKRSLINNRFNN